MPFDDIRFLISAVCALLLILVVTALILNKGFRQDLVASEGKASLFGLVSVEGVMVLILCALFLFGMIYPITRDANPVVVDNDAAKELEVAKKEISDLKTETHGLKGRNKHISEENDRLVSENTDLKTENKKLDRLNRNLVREKSDLQSDVDKLQQQVNGSITKDTIPDFVKALKIDDEISVALKHLANTQKGPWALTSDTREVVISVPGRYQKGRNYSCQKYHNKRVELISNYRRDGQVVKGNTNLVVKINGLIAQTQKCRDIYQIDFQLSCFDAQALFSSDVLECDQNNNPRWKEGVARKLPAFATILQDDVRVNNDGNNMLAGSH